MREKVAILGKLETKYCAPFNDNTFDIWTMNRHNDHNRLKSKRIDLCFDIHKVPQNPEADLLRKDFPFQECEQLVGGNYYNNTVAYMIAYAILKNYKQINLYGMRFLSDHERRHGEFQCVQNLMCFAMGKGIKVQAPADPMMLNDIMMFRRNASIIENRSGEYHIAGNEAKAEPNSFRTNEITKTCLQYIDKGIKDIFISGVTKSYSNLIFYAKGLGVNIKNISMPLVELPNYNMMSGKDFDVY